MLWPRPVHGADTEDHEVDVAAVLEPVRRAALKQDAVELLNHPRVVVGAEVKRGFSVHDEEAVILAQVIMHPVLATRLVLLQLDGHQLAMRAMIAKAEVRRPRIEQMKRAGVGAAVVCRIHIATPML